ncbi:MAG: type II toxin-antitoxin system PemK/MazF family toxin [Spirochaetaceae bacterium]|nr:type II toxin-antitoxin system PemK/MazF family toxin [Spirochaetaceae bacterium]
MIRGEIWWVDLGIPFGSEPGYKRPVVIIQDDSFNKSKIQTVIVASITSNMNLVNAPGNVHLEKEESKLLKDSVINISQITTLDKQRLIENISILSPSTMNEIDYGLRIILNI